MDKNIRDCIIIKGYIDAKNEHDRIVYGSFVAITDRRASIHSVAWFSRNAMPKNVDWRQLLHMQAGRAKDGGRDPSDIKCEDQLVNFFSKSSVLPQLCKNRNTKQAEQGVSRFCMEEMGLRAVTFLEFYEASENDIKHFETVKEKHKTEQKAQKSAGRKAAEDMKGGKQQKASETSDIFVRCEPQLDPVDGVAMSELKVGDSIYAKLPANSVFYKLLAKSRSSFDGVVTAEITGTLVNELETVTLSLKLSDGVNGVVKLPAKVKIRTAASTPTRRAELSSSRQSGPTGMSPEFLVGLGFCIVMIAAVLAVMYVFAGE